MGNRIDDYAPAFRLCVKYLEGQGLISHPEEKEPLFWECQLVWYSWGQVARECASFMPGTWQLASGNKGVSWSMGRNGTVGVLVIHSLYDEVRQARAQVVRAGFWMPDEVYSIGSVASNLINQIFPHDKPLADYRHMEREIMGGISWGYHRCVPGEYDYLELWDVKSCYYSLIRRLPSIRMWVGRDGLEPWKMDDREAKLWDQALSAVHPNKDLRNTLHGVMTGGHNSKPFWYNRNGAVVKKERPPFMGKFRIAGMLVVQAAYCLTREECLRSDGKYSTIDCVASARGLAGVYRAAGLEVDFKGRGPSHICHRSSYRIGHKATMPYQAKEHEPLPEDGGGLPHRDLSPCWLGKVTL